VRQRFGSPVLDTAVRLLAPFVLLFAAYVLTHGHYGPGGGFQAGVLFAIGLLLVRLVRGERTRWALGPRASLALAGAGLALYLGIGFLGPLFGGGFLDYGAAPLDLPPAQLRALGSFGVEVGVGLAVGGVVLVLFDALARATEG
jgi:multicomponent Na+:H+ antiporter subunit B